MLLVGEVVEHGCEIVLHRAGGQTDKKGRNKAQNEMYKLRTPFFNLATSLSKGCLFFRFDPLLFAPELLLQQSRGRGGRVVWEGGH